MPSQKMTRPFTLACLLCGALYSCPPPLPVRAGEIGVSEVGAGGVSAGKNVVENVDPVVEIIEVKHAKTKGPKHPSLRFLKDNRVFLRARLDQLRLQTKRVRAGEAELLDARYLRLQELAAAIAAARDTVGHEHNVTTQRELLTSVTQLGDLEGQLDLLEELLADQRQRLLWLEEDFLGHQETALVILIKGFAGKHAPEAIVLAEENEIVRVSLTPTQRESLQKGGIAQIYHEFVEPRDHVFEVSFSGGVWSETEPAAVPITAARDRLTFLELDLGGLDRDREASDLTASVWQR